MQIRGKSFDRRGYDIGHDARALTAAEYRQPKRVRCLRSGVGDRRGCDHCWANRIAGACRLGTKLRGALEHVRKADGDSVNPRRLKSVGAPHHRVLLVNQARNIAQRRGQHRRDGRIAAEADDRRGPRAREQA